MALKQVTLPELGENIAGGDVVAVLVSAGERVRKDQPLIEVESEKATVEIPAPFAGVVKEILVEPGDRIQVGQAILVLETDAGREAPDREAPAPPRDGAYGEKYARPEASSDRPASLPARAVTAADGGEAPATGEEEGTQTTALESADRDAGEAVDPGGGRATEATGGPGGGGFPVQDLPRAEERTEALPLPAGPSSRRLARELGLDIRSIPGSGPGGRILPEDVKERARHLLLGRVEHATPEGFFAVPQAPDAHAQPELPDFTKWGEVVRRPMGSLRRTAARTTRRSWSLIPHVTQFDHADVTDLERQRKSLPQDTEGSGGKVTVTAVVIRVAAAALKRFDRFHASLDADREEIVYKKYLNIGVAVDTEYGLVVPVIRDADRKSLRQISSELGRLAERARAKKLTPEEMSGSDFNVTNLGGLGTTYFTPIVTWPHTAVLGVGRAEFKPAYRDGALVPRQILPLSVSYDHRLIDGADAARFLRWIAQALENPLTLLLEG